MQDDSDMHTCTWQTLGLNQKANKGTNVWCNVMRTYEWSSRTTFVISSHDKAAVFARWFRHVWWALCLYMRWYVYITVSVMFYFRPSFLLSHWAQSFCTASCPNCAATCWILLTSPARPAFTAIRYADFSFRHATKAAICISNATED